MKNAVILTGPGFEDAELIYPLYRVQEAGFNVEIATKDKQDVTGKWGYQLKATIDTKELNANKYDLIIIPGGYEAPDRVRQIPEVLSFLKDADKKKKIIAAICHGPWVLISAGLMKGRKATCYKGCKDDLINAGAKYIDESVVVDGNIITSPHFRDLAQWMKEVIKKFKE
jgi:protease I